MADTDLMLNLLKGGLIYKDLRGTRKTRVRKIAIDDRSAIAQMGEIIAFMTDPVVIEVTPNQTFAVVPKSERHLQSDWMLRIVWRDGLGLTLVGRDELRYIADAQAFVEGLRALGVTPAIAGLIAGAVRRSYLPARFRVELSFYRYREHLADLRRELIEQRNLPYPVELEGAESAMEVLRRWEESAKGRFRELEKRLNEPGRKPPSVIYL